MISAHFARVLYRDLLAQGITEKQLLSGTQLNQTLIWQARQLDPEEFLIFLGNARRLLGDRRLGFMVAGSNRLSGLGMMGMAMLSAPTLLQGLQAMSSFSSLQAGYLTLQVIAGRDQTRISIQLTRDLGDCLDTHIESVLSIIQEYLIDIRGAQIDGLSFNLSYSDEGLRDDYEAHLQGTVHFNTGRNELLLPTSWLSTPSPYADPDLWLLARQALSTQLQELTGLARKPFSAHLRSQFSAQLPPLPTIAAAADTLHVSVRTLNRRLREEGTTFRQLRLEATHSWAKRLLRDGDSIDSVALALGYENPANFRRSFKAFVGCSPTEWLARSVTKDTLKV